MALQRGTKRAKYDDLHVPGGWVIVSGDHRAPLSSSELAGGGTQ